MNELILNDEFEQMQKIASMVAKGESLTSIARYLNVPRKVVVEQYEQWKAVATNDEVVRERSRAVLAEADEHYNHILKEYWSVIDESDSAGGIDGLKVKNAALKNIADVTAKRVEFLQRAGLIEDASMAEHYAEIEEKAEMIKELLAEVAKQYPETRMLITEGLGRIFNQPTGIIVTGEVARTD